MLGAGYVPGRMQRKHRSYRQTWNECVSHSLREMGIANNRRKVGHRRLWRMAEEKLTRKLYYARTHATVGWSEARCISVWLFVCKRISWYWRQCAGVSYSYGFVTARKIIVNHSCGEVRWLAYRLRWRTSVASDSLECSWTREGCVGWIDGWCDTVIKKISYSSVRRRMERRVCPKVTAMIICTLSVASHHQSYYSYCTGHGQVSESVFAQHNYASSMQVSFFLFHCRGRGSVDWLNGHKTGDWCIGGDISIHSNA